ncbi:AMP-binding protein [Novosphingobium sp. Gsoil 351]|uniref:AMP-binding protein n=1 Tax=Novosphingobium sp. Gsoil 351 TaxID=2675225 RepID=UPI00351BA942
MVHAACAPAGLARYWTLAISRASSSSFLTGQPDHRSRSARAATRSSGASRSGTDAPALLLRSGPLSYEALRAGVAKLAGWLGTVVREPGARVACWLPKTELACLMPLAAARAGLVYVPINPLLKRAQVAHILADSGAMLLIANAARLATLEPGDRAGAEMIDERDAWAGVEDASPLGDPSRHDPAQLAQILYTSGSTGKPKGVMLNHANLWFGAVSVATYLKLAPHDRLLGVMR